MKSARPPTRAAPNVTAAMHAARTKTVRRFMASLAAGRSASAFELIGAAARLGHVGAVRELGHEALVGGLGLRRLVLILVDLRQVEERMVARQREARVVHDLLVGRGGLVGVAGAELQVGQRE